MNYEKELAFLRQLLQGMNISSCVLSDPEKCIPPEIDLHLRADLFSLENYVDFLQNSMLQAKERTLYRFYDEYNCSYIFLRLPEEKTFFFIGPYLLSLPTEEQIAKKANDLALTKEKIQRIHLYYSSLPLIEDENLLLTMANTLASLVWGAPEQYSMEYIDYAIYDRYEPIPHTNLSAQGRESSVNLSALEQLYAAENQLMEAVRKGKLHQVTAVASNVFNTGVQHRLPDSLRDRKNYLVILKTLLRKAAEYGGVHPLHIDRLSFRYATEIENICTIKESLSLQEDMIRSYCKLVKTYSLSKYSYYVGQVITMVQYDLTADLHLKTISEKLNVNSSYLSNLFHREVGCTLTDFINKQRVDHGIMLLRKTEKSVQEIATECGVQDVNYFIRLFKKQTGMTPGQYKKTI